MSRLRVAATLLALAIGGGLVFLALGGAIGEERLLVFGDARAAGLADALQTRSADRVVALLTDLGALPVTALLVAITALWAQRTHRAPTGAALVGGLALTWIAVHVAKATEARPRPGNGVTETLGLSYPSGHSAYAVALVACAVVLARDQPRPLVRAVILGGAVSLALFVGASRIYLRVHYLSDVLGGFGLAVAVFALCGLAALAVGRFRHTGARA